MSQGLRPVWEVPWPGLARVPLAAWCQLGTDPARWPCVSSCEPGGCRPSLRVAVLASGPSWGSWVCAGLMMVLETVALKLL